MAPWVAVLGRAVVKNLRLSGLAEVMALLPSRKEGLQELSDWVATSQSGGELEDDVPGLTDEQVARQRSRLGTLDMFKGWGEATGRVFSTYWRGIPAEARRQLHLLLTRAKLLRPVEQGWLMDKFKKLAGMAKRFRDELFGEWWKYYVDLGAARDVQPTVDIAQFVDDIRDWCQGEVVHAVAGNEERFDELFRAGVRRFLTLAPCRQSQRQNLSPMEWAEDPERWARSGTSDGERLQVLVEEGGRWKIRKARKSKWATALALDMDKMQEMLMVSTRQRNKAIQKREAQKVRAVIAGDLPLYLKMSYVGEWLEDALRGHPESTLFFSAEQQMNLWNKMALHCELQSVKVPLDQDQFDHVVTRKMIRIVNEEIKRFAANKAPIEIRQYILEMMDRIQYGVEEGTVQVGSVVLNYEKGVMSGWRWTALYDTLINAAELYVAQQIVIERMGADPIMSYCAQGDDDQIECRTYALAVALCSVYSEVGLRINPGKFFIAQDADEFLRQVAWKDDVSGYPARAAAALVFRNPTSRDELRGEERIREMANSWNQFFNRQKKWNWPMAIQDIANSNKTVDGKLVEVDKVWAMFATPACVGGIGMFLRDEGGRVKGKESGEWYVATKARMTPSWKYGRIGGLVRALGEKWAPVLGLAKQDAAKAVAQVYKTNIEVNRAMPEIEPFTWERVEHFRPMKYFACTWIAETGVELVARGRPDIPPTISGMLRERIVKEKNFRLLAEWIDQTQVSDMLIVTRNCSRSVALAWVEGKLPFKTPIREGWSQLAISNLYSGLARSHWHKAIAYGTNHYANMAYVRRAAYAAELALDRVLAAQVVKVGG